MQDRTNHVHIALEAGDRELLEKLKKKAGTTSDADAFLYLLRQVANDSESLADPKEAGERAPEVKWRMKEGDLILKQYREDIRIRPIPRPQIQVKEALRGLGKTIGGLKGGGTGGLGGL